MSFGLVFAGGGARGSYEVGVWSALKQMGVEINAVTGVSIGSINGALFVQDDLETVVDLWYSIQMKNIIDCNKLKSDNLFDAKNIIGIANEVYKNQGLDTSPLYYILKKVIDEDKIRKSSIEYGLATYSLTDRCEIELFKNEIPDGMLVEYLMASACLPGFQSCKIDDKVFIDGGVNNNMPINMLVEKGYKDIIAIDVGGIGFVKSFNQTGVNIIRIICENNIIGTMQFEKQGIRKNIKKGYYDCYKAFGRLSGKIYYFNTMSYYRAKMQYSDITLDCIEYAGQVFGIEQLASYRIDDFIRGVIKAYEKANKEYKKLRKTLKQQSLFEVIGKTKLHDSLITCWIVDLIKNGNNGFMNNKLMTGLLGNNLSAANAIIYLTK